MNLNIVKVISTRVVDSFRNIKFLRMGKSDVQETEQIGPHGFDSNPVKDMAAVYAPTLQQGEPVILGYINKKQLDLEPGESLMFATDENGVLQTWIRMRADGTMEVAGDADFMVRFNPLKSVIDEMQNDIGTLKNVFSSWVPAPNDGGAALKAAAATWYGSPLTQNIDNAKIDEIKTL